MKIEVKCDERANYTGRANNTETYAPPNNLKKYARETTSRHTMQHPVRA